MSIHDTIQGIDMSIHNTIQGIDISIHNTIQGIDMSIHDPIQGMDMSIHNTIDKTISPCIHPTIIIIKEGQTCIQCVEEEDLSDTNHNVLHSLFIRKAYWIAGAAVGNGGDGGCDSTWEISVVLRPFRTKLLTIWTCRTN